MKEYPVYNMESQMSEFEICGYQFIRTHDYDSKIELMHRTAVVTKDPDEERWIQTTEECPGTHQHTYTALWNGDKGTEPISKIYLDGNLIQDILLLWSIWNNRCPLAGDRALYMQHHYYSDKYFKTDSALISAIQHSLESITDKDDAKSKKLYPTLFLIQESNFTPIWQYKTLFLSPAIDVVSKSDSCQVEDIYSQEEIEMINALKADIRKLIDEKQLSRNILENAINPFLSKVSTIGSLSAVDHIYNWVNWTLDITDEKDCWALKDHCIVFNQFRNSVIHYAGLPGRKIKLRLLNNTFEVSPYNGRVCTKVGIYYFFVFREILQLWIAKILGIDGIRFCNFDKDEVLNFIRFGIWREVNIFEEEFCK